MRPESAPTTEHSLRFSILGPLRAWYRDTELHLGPPKQQGVLALLLVQAGQPVPLHHLIDALWGDDPPERAVNVVHRHVGALRRLLEPGLMQRSKAQVLVRAAGGYRLNLDEGASDLLRFRRLRDAGHEAADGGRPEEAADLLLEALSTRHGPTAAGLPHELRSHPVFAAVDAEYYRAAQAAAEASLAAGRTKAALPLLRQAAQGDLLNEFLQAGFVRVLAAEGHTAQALEHYRSVRSRLASELGVDPGPELRAAQTDVLRGTDAARTSDTAPSTPAATASPERIWSSVRPAQLPATLQVFTGRREEMKRLDSLLPGDTHTAVSIGGAPGVGKTTLALHWAHRNSHRFPDGQLYINLRGYDPAGEPLSPSMAICYFLESLGIPSERIPSHLDSQIALYRSILARRRCLIVLDNARNAEQVRPLLPGNPDCFTVITSREEMTGLAASAAASLLNVDILTTTESFDFLSRRLGKARVERERNTALEIAAHCGRLPLALAIVCARTGSQPTIPLSDIAAELESSRDSLRAFTLSGEGDPVTDARSVFSWSFRTLTKQAADAFIYLCLSPAHSVSIHAAASLTGLTMKSTRRVMSELHRANLWTEYRTGQYNTHDLLKVFSQGLARSDSSKTLRAARQRLYDHYLHTAHNASSAVNTHREHSALTAAAPGTHVISFTSTAYAAGWLHQEMPALQAIVLHHAHYDAGAQAWRLAAILELIFDRSGRRQEQIAIQSSALSAAQQAGDTRGQAHMHRSLGFALGRTGDHSAAEIHLREALKIFSGGDDLLGAALTHRYQAFLSNIRKQHHKALTQYESASSLYQNANDEIGLAAVTNEVGWTHILLQDFECATECCRHAIGIAHKVGNRNIEAASWDSLGVAYHRLGRHSDALEALNRALVLYRELNDAYLIADTLIHIGDVHSPSSPHEAHQAWTDALKILDSLGHPEGDLLRERISKK
jgi:DNA-binding SARP family transcriptional activator